MSDQPAKAASETRVVRFARGAKQVGSHPRTLWTLFFTSMGGVAFSLLSPLVQAQPVKEAVERQPQQVLDNAKAAAIEAVKPIADNYTALAAEVRSNQEANTKHLKEIDGSLLSLGVTVKEVRDVFVGGGVNGEDGVMKRLRSMEAKQDAFSRQLSDLDWEFARASKPPR